METGKIYNEDCMETMARMEDNSVDLVLTDIPYGEVNKMGRGRNKYEGELRKVKKGIADDCVFNLTVFLNEIKRIVNGGVYIFCGIEQVSEIFNFFNEKNKKYFMARHCVWCKNNPSPMNGEHYFLSATENCIYAKKRKTKFYGNCEKNYWQFNTGKSKTHPTQKPVDLFSYLIKQSSKKRDIVYDPFIGSGTTAVACEKLDRKWIGSEISERYCKLARERIKIERDQGKLF